MSREPRHAGHGAGPYPRLGVMLVLSFLAMFGLMYAMVDRRLNALPNLNQAYMAALMAAAMVVIELVVMWSMYPNKRLNSALISLGLAAGVVSWLLIRQQTGISDRQFLMSMVPHHAGAILMCRQATIRDPEIENLCEAIVRSQQQEIDFMRAKLRAGR